MTPTERRSFPTDIGVRHSASHTPSAKAAKPAAPCSMRSASDSARRPMTISLFVKGGQPDLAQVMFVMGGDLVEFVAQGAHAVDAVHELQVATALVVHAGIIDDGAPRRFVDPPRELERAARIVESLGPGILIHHRHER